MDGYPPGSLDHNVPFLVACGLTPTAHEPSLPDDLEEQGIVLESELPPLDTRESKVLAEHFEKVDKEGHSWAGVERDELYKFRVKSVGRVRNARPSLSRDVKADMRDSPMYYLRDMRGYLRQRSPCNLPGSFTRRSLP